MFNGKISESYGVIVIGGGASGLACALTLAQGNKNLKICVIEAGERFGKKLAASGNGQGNVSNENLSTEFYGGGNLALVEKVACADSYAGTKLFDCLFSADGKGRIYPVGKQASALSDNLISKLRSHGNVRLVSGVKAERIEVVGGEFLVFSDVVRSSHFIVMCTGGKAQKQFNTDGSAYRLATDFGHTLTPLYPSLVQLKTETVHIKTLKGIRADCVVSAVYNGKVIAKSRGDVIFTDYGVSGNAIFAVSSYITDKSGVTLSLEFLPEFSAAAIENNLALRKSGGCADSELLSGSLHNQIGRAIIKRAGSSEVKTIVNVLKNFTLPVTGNLGFDYAQVTKGGIEMKEISGELESKLVKNMFFAGEILDVDGACGGYNLQWAFTSGIAAAEAILKRL